MGAFKYEKNYKLEVRGRYSTTVNDKELLIIKNRTDKEEQLDNQTAIKKNKMTMWLKITKLVNVDEFIAEIWYLYNEYSQRQFDSN